MSHLKSFSPKWSLVVSRIFTDSVNMNESKMKRYRVLKYSAFLKKKIYYSSSPKKRVQFPNPE